MLEHCSKMTQTNACKSTTKDKNETAQRFHDYRYNNSFFYWKSIHSQYFSRPPESAHLQGTSCHRLCCVVTPRKWPLSPYLFVMTVNVYNPLGMVLVVSREKKLMIQFRDPETSRTL